METADRQELLSGSDGEKMPESEEESEDEEGSEAEEESDDEGSDDAERSNGVIKSKGFTDENSKWLKPALKKKDQGKLENIEKQSKGKKKEKLLKDDKEEKELLKKKKLLLVKIHLFCFFIKFSMSKFMCNSQDRIRK